MNPDAIKNKLGKPYFEAEGILLYNTDCMSAMRALPALSVDLTLTSPPYNIGKAYENPMPLDEYLEWCERWIAQVYRLTKPDGAFWLNLGYLEIPGKAKAVPIPYLLWNRTPFYLLQEVVWNYGAGVATKRMFAPRNEKLLWYVKSPDRYTFNLDDVRDPDVKYPNQKKNGKLKCNPLGKNPSDVWQIAKVTSGTNRSSKERTPHPAQFPLAMIDRIVKACSNEWELVVDPFIGSGTTAVAALVNNRQVLGFEISEEYCQITIMRVRQLFAERERRAVQTPLFGLEAVNL